MNQLRILRQLLFFLALSIGIVLITWAQFAWAQSAELPEPTKVELISNLEALKPGESFLVGISFSIDSGWHIYGKSPGELGLPTKIKFNFPAGVSAKEVIWPPEEYFKLGATEGHGYSGKLMLVAEVESDAAVLSSEQVLLEANASWLNCSEKICIPAKKKLSLPIKLAKESKASINADKFQDRKAGS